MKLRNKKTGECNYYPITHRVHKSGDMWIAVVKDGKYYSSFERHEPIYDYKTLEELNQDWEDVK